MCDEIIEVIKTVPTKAVPRKTIFSNFNKKTVTFKIENLYVVLTFLLITTSVLVIVSIYYYLLKHQSNQEIYYHVTILLI